MPPLEELETSSIKASYDMDAVEAVITWDVTKMGLLALYKTPDEFLTAIVPSIIQMVFGGWDEFELIYLQYKVSFSDTSIRRKIGRGSHLCKANTVYCPSNEDISGDPFNISLGGYKVIYTRDRHNKYTIKAPLPLIEELYGIQGAISLIKDQILNASRMICIFLNDNYFHNYYSAAHYKVTILQYVSLKISTMSVTLRYNLIFF